MVSINQLVSLAMLCHIPFWKCFTVFPHRLFVLPSALDHYHHIPSTFSARPSPCSAVSYDSLSLPSHQAFQFNQSSSEMKSILFSFHSCSLVVDCQFDKIQYVLIWVISLLLVCADTGNSDRFDSVIVVLHSAYIKSKFLHLILKLNALPPKPERAKTKLKPFQRHR